MDVKIDAGTGFLDKLARVFKQDPKIHIGILGDGKRTDGQLTNAEIGYKHEMGVDGPQRSFLRMPLTAKLGQELATSDVLSDASLKELATVGSMLPLCQKIGIMGEAVIADAFDTGGFGEWPESDMRLKKNHQTLVETQQLRNSITSEVDI